MREKKKKIGTKRLCCIEQKFKKRNLCQGIGNLMGTDHTVWTTPQEHTCIQNSLCFRSVCISRQSSLQLFICYNWRSQAVCSIRLCLFPGRPKGSCVCLPEEGLVFTADRENTGPTYLGEQDSLLVSQQKRTFYSPTLFDCLMGDSGSKWDFPGLFFWCWKIQSIFKLHQSTFQA